MATQDKDYKSVKIGKGYNDSELIAMYEGNEVVAVSEPHDTTYSRTLYVADIKKGEEISAEFNNDYDIKIN